MSTEEQIANLENKIESLESQTNFRLLLLGVATLGAALVGVLY